MATTQRFQVRNAAKTWDDPGPDLLRPKTNARRQLAALMGPRLKDWHVRTLKASGEKSDWGKSIRKHEALAAFDRMRTVEFILGRELNDGTFEDVIHVRREDVTLLPLDNCSPATILNHSLIEHRFPGAIFAGGYLYRQIDDSDDWSDHAYGTAIDETEHEPDTPNDAVFDWCARMARAGCMDFDYLLGSRDNHVVSCAAPDFDVEMSGADPSHLWHCHMSVVDHHGVKPPREGGVF